jgi:hypothetical protein
MTTPITFLGPPLPGEAQISHYPDHAARAVNRLAQQFRQTVSWPKLVNVFAKQCQEIEDALYAMLLTDVLTGTSGIALDQLGAWLNETRNGKTDSEYIVFLQSAIISNAASGTLPDIDSLYNTLLGLLYPSATLTLAESGVAAMSVNIAGVPLPDFEAAEMLRILRKTKASGVKVIQEWLEVTLANTFQFASTGDGSTAAPTGKGFDDGTFTVGGIFANALE